MTRISTTLDIEPQQVIDGLDNIEFDEILVLGWDCEDELFVASSTGEKRNHLLLIEEFKQRLMNGEWD